MLICFNDFTRKKNYTRFDCAKFSGFKSNIKHSTRSAVNTSRHCRLFLSVAGKKHLKKKRPDEMSVIMF